MKKILISVGMAVLGMTSLASSSKATTAAETVVQTHNSFDFAISNHTDFGNEVYYNCDSVEDYAEALLTKMGAKNVSVSCTGGIEDGVPMPMPSVKVSFDSLRLPGTAVEGKTTYASWTHVKLQDFENCHLATQIIKNVQDHFEIRGLKGMGHCFDSNSSYRIELSTLMN